MTPSKNRLGRGLGSIIAGAKTQPLAKAETPAVPAATSVAVLPILPSSAPEFRAIAVNSVEPNPRQPRRDFDEASIQELADSIRSEGLIQPIVVRQTGDKYELIAGERRWRACKMLGLSVIPARVIVATDASSAVMALIENLQRRDLNPVEESLGYASLVRDFSLTQEEAGERVGKGRATVANALRLLGLATEIQGYLSKGLISTGHAKVLLMVTDTARRLVLARRTIEGGWSVRDLEREARRAKAAQHQNRDMPEAEATVIEDLEKRIAKKLNTRVSVKHTPKHGRIVIEYFGNEDLQRILEMLGVNE